jgi:uncharacterized MnhB-related membrane protein
MDRLFLIVAVWLPLFLVGGIATLLEAPEVAQTSALVGSALVGLTCLFPGKRQ